MQSEAQLPVSTSTHDKSGLKRSSCFPLSFPSVPASCFSPWSLLRLHPISMLHGEGKHSLPKVLLLGKGDLSQYCETALRTAEVAACCWKELFGTNLLSSPGFLSHFQCGFWSHSRDELQGRLNLCYRIVWKKFSWGKEAGVSIFQGMGGDNHKNVHPEILGYKRGIFIFPNRYCEN